MSEFIDYLYSRFLLRDVLAKVIPGLIAIVAVTALFARHPFHRIELKHLLPDVAFLATLYGLSFMAGMIIQFVAMKARLSLIHVWPGADGISSEEMSLYFARAFSVHTRDDDAASRVRERYVVLKEMSGNYAGALTLLLVAIFIRYCLFGSPEVPKLVGIGLLLALLVVVLRWQNRFHAMEQRTWETLSLLGTEAKEHAAG